MTKKLLSVFSAVVSLILFLGVGAVLSPAQAQFNQEPAIDSGQSCSRDSDCVELGVSGMVCQQNSCVLPLSAVESNAKTKEIKDRNEANQLEEPSAFKSAAVFNRGTLADFACALMGTVANCTHEYDGRQVASGGVISSFNKTIAAMYNKPASTEAYVADLLQDLNIAQPAYAQGIGFSALNPILDTWKVFRNLAYLFFIVIFLVIAFMIMFRQKVGQAAITAQQAIPNIIIALIMVTFSYAIAGFLIDAMYFIMFLIIGLFETKENLIDLNFLQLGLALISRGWVSVGVIGEFIDSSLQSLTELVAEPIEFISEIAFHLIIATAILIGIFRLFFELLKTYITIIISIALSPVILMMGAIPGRNVFTSWLQGLIGNLAAFPTVMMVLVIFDMLVNAQGIDEAGFIPPFLFGSGSGGVIPALVGLGLVLALPDVVKKVKESLGAKDSFGWLTSAALRSVSKGEPAIPLAFGAAGGLAGGIEGGYRGYKEGLRGAALRNAIFQGVEERDEEGNLLRVRGGMSPRASNFYNFGKETRGAIDDIRHDRWLQPDNWRKLAEKMRVQQKPDKADDKPSGDTGI